MNYLNSDDEQIINAYKEGENDAANGFGYSSFYLHNHNVCDEQGDAYRAGFLAGQA